MVSNVRVGGASKGGVEKYKGRSKKEEGLWGLYSLKRR